jgi:hypothetical protein
MQSCRKLSNVFRWNLAITWVLWGGNDRVVLNKVAGFLSPFLSTRRSTVTVQRQSPATADAHATIHAAAAQARRIRLCAGSPAASAHVLVVDLATIYTSQIYIDSNSDDCIPHMLGRYIIDRFWKRFWWQGQHNQCVQSKCDQSCYLVQVARLEINSLRENWHVYSFHRKSLMVAYCCSSSFFASAVQSRPREPQSNPSTLEYLRCETEQRRCCLVPCTKCYFFPNDSYS